MTLRKRRPISLGSDWTPKALLRKCREGKTGTKRVTSSVRRGDYRLSDVARFLIIILQPSHYPPASNRLPHTDLNQL